MGWDGKDNRRKKRYAVKDGALRYRKGGLFSFLKSASPKYLLLNFSETGCHFITKEEMAAGQRLRVFIHAARLTGEVAASGSVMWCRKSKQVEAFHVGVRFEPLGARSRARLKILLDSAILENVDISTKVYLKESERL